MKWFECLADILLHNIGIIEKMGLGSPIISPQWFVWPSSDGLISIIGIFFWRWSKLSNRQRSFEWGVSHSEGSEWEVSHWEVDNFHESLKPPLNLPCYIYVWLHTLVLAVAAVQQVTKSVSQSLHTLLLAVAAV